MSTIISVAGLTIEPTLVLNEWATSNEPQSIVHTILGRPDPDITLRAAAFRTGTLRLLFWDATAAESARALHTTAAVCSVSETDLPWLPAAYVPNGPITLTQQPNGDRWLLEVPFQEVAS